MRAASIYLDHNAAAPPHPAAIEVWLDAVGRLWHNPSSLTPAGTRAREAIEGARETLADILGCDPGRIVFTAGATESANALARHVGAMASRSEDRRPLALLSPIEHPSVADAFAAHLGERVRSTGCDEHGVVRPETVAMLLDDARVAGDRVGLVSVMAASNESGVLEPWPEIARICRNLGVPFHTDATQWLGRLPAGGIGACDWVTASGHKCGAPKGVGFLVVPEGQRLRAAHGGPQEGGRRAGTEDTAGILALVAAIGLRDAQAAADRGERAAFRDAAERRLHERLPWALVVGANAPRLWNTLAILLPGRDARRIVAQLAAAGVAASTGSACSSGAGSTPSILAAIGADRLGVTADDLRGMIRLSAGWETTGEDWLSAIDILADVADGNVSLPSVDLANQSAIQPSAASREARSSAASMKAQG